jgi:hypothetical protein
MHLRTTDPLFWSMAALVTLACFCTACHPAVNRESPPARTTIRSLAIGNDALAGTMAPLHADLARSAGATWHSALLGDRDLSLYMNLYWFCNDWSWRDRELWTPDGPRKLRDAVTGSPWDVLVVQPCGRLGNHASATALGTRYDPKLSTDLALDDFGDVPVIGRLLERVRQHQPQVGLAVFLPWPELPTATPADGTPGCRAIPDRAGFDLVGWWQGVGQARQASLLRELATQHPDLVAANRLWCVPMGAVLAEIERDRRAGALAGCPPITDWYADTTHLRMGLPRYVAAASLYAVLFGAPPHALDWKPYNDPARYQAAARGPRQALVHEPCLGELLPITPDLAQAVNDRIATVVRRSAP